MEYIRPGVQLPNGETVYPTNVEWLLAFAIAGCKWAEEALEDAVENHNRDEIEKHFGENI
jgi:hypothetical protein